MQILNAACGAVRPGPPFINLDSLHALLAPGTPERQQLDAESNYVEHDLRNPLPFPNNHFDGVLLSHVLEHFDAIVGTLLLKDCLAVLKPGGTVMVSVPDASYHRTVYPRDNKKNAMKLFGETIPESEPKQTFLEYALCFLDHRHIYCDDSLWAILVNSGFASCNILRICPKVCESSEVAFALMHQQLNRRQFSLVMIATK